MINKPTAEAEHRAVAGRVRQRLLQWGVLGSLPHGAGLVSVFLLLWAGYIIAARPVTLVINDETYQVRLHRLTVEAVLQELGLALAAEDIVQPPPGSELVPGQVVTVQLAHPVVVEADGRARPRLTHQTTVAGLLSESGVRTNPHDVILVDGSVVSPQAMLPRRPPEPKTMNRAAALFFSARIPRSALVSARPAPLRLLVRRAVPVTLREGQVKVTFYTTQPNVGEALLEQGITLFLGDHVTPGLGTPLSPGMRIFIDRSRPVGISVDGRTIQTRSRRETVGEVLAQEGIALMGQDYSRPADNQLISAGDFVEVVRVSETIEIEEEFIPFETNWIDDEALELDRQEVRQAGATGVIKTRTRVRYENGQRVWRESEDEWLDREPSNRLVAYGTKIVVRTLETESGPIEYWRKISMVTTAYNAANSGKEPDHPRYGLTRSGLQAGYGIVAVDPKVIPLMTELYIPGYGLAVAGDTGGRILGKHVDLGFDDDQPLPILYEWRDVYVVTPVPPANKVRYVLPQWPQR